jgi:hypothetical protein
MTKKKYSIPSGVFSLEPGQKKRKRKSSSSPKDLQSKTWSVPSEITSRKRSISSEKLIREETTKEPHLRRVPMTTKKKCSIPCRVFSLKPRQKNETIHFHSTKKKTKKKKMVLLRTKKEKKGGEKKRKEEEIKTIIPCAQ